VTLGVSVVFTGDARAPTTGAGAMSDLDSYMLKGKVPGGWVYHNWDHEKDRAEGPIVYVPEPQRAAALSPELLGELQAGYETYVEWVGFEEKHPVPLVAAVKKILATQERER